MMNVFFESFITFWQTNIIIRFLVTFFGMKKEKNKMLLICLGTLSVGITVIVFNSITYYEGMAAYFYIFELIILANIFLKGKILPKIIVSCSIMVVISLVTTLVMKMMAVIGNQNLIQIYSEMSMYRACGIVLIQTILEFIALVIGKRFGQSKINFQKMEWAIILLNITCSLFIIFTLNFLEFQLLSKKASYLILVLVFLVIMMNIILFFLLCRLNESNIRIRENEAIQLKYNYYEELVSRITLQYTELYQIKHDIKHLGQTMNILIQQREYDSLQMLFQEWNQQVHFYEHVIKTGNHYVDALLNTKLNYAQSKGIEVKFNIVTGFEGIDNTDIINLLGNLLDNAIEANEYERESRCLELNIAGDMYSISMQVKNTIMDSVLKNVHYGKTSKNNEKEHGYGLKIIQRIVNKYDGNILYHEEKGILYADVVLVRK